MFKNLFGMFGGDKSNSLGLKDLDKGFTFLYRGVQWTVLEEHSYDWGDEGDSREYKVEGDGQFGFLEVEDDEAKLLVNFSIDLNASEILPTLSHDDFVGDDIYENIEYQQKSYQLKEIYDGHFKNITNYEMSQKLTNYNYKDGAHFVCVDQWSDGTITFSAGQAIATSAISEIQKS